MDGKLKKVEEKEHKIGSKDEGKQEKLMSAENSLEMCFKIDWKDKAVNFLTVNKSDLDENQKWILLLSIACVAKARLGNWKSIKRHCWVWSFQSICGQ